MYEVWAWIKTEVSHRRLVFSEDVKNKVMEVYSPKKPGFSNWSYLFRKKPMIDVTLKFAHNGDNNPEWRVLRIFNPSPPRDSDDEKDPEMSEEE